MRRLRNRISIVAMVMAYYGIFGAISSRLALRFGLDTLESLALIAGSLALGAVIKKGLAMEFIGPDGADQGKPR